MVMAGSSPAQSNNVKAFAIFVDPPTAPESGLMWLKMGPSFPNSSRCLGIADLRGVSSVCALCQAAPQDCLERNVTDTAVQFTLAQMQKKLVRRVSVPNESA